MTMEALSFDFDDVIRRICRRGSRETSVDAARAVAPHITKLQDAVLEAFRRRGDMPDVTLYLVLSLYSDVGIVSESSVRTRRCELVRMGKLKEKGVVKNKGQRKMTVWGLA